MIKQKVLKVPNSNFALDDLGMYTKVGEISPNCQLIPFTFRKNSYNTQIHQFKSADDKLNFIRYFIFNYKVTFDSQAPICGSTMTGQFKNHWSDSYPVTFISGGWYRGTLNDLEKFHQKINEYMPKCTHDIKYQQTPQQTHQTIHKFCQVCLETSSAITTNLVSKSYFLEHENLLDKLLNDDFSNNLSSLFSKEFNISDKTKQDIISHLTLEDLLTMEIIDLLPLRFNCNEWHPV